MNFIEILKLNFFRSILESFQSTVEQIHVKLDKGQLEKPLDQSTKPGPLHDRAMARKEDVVEVESLRWQLASKDKEYKEVVKAHKDLHDKLVIYKAQLEREKNRESDQNVNDFISAEALREALQIETK